MTDYGAGPLERYEDSLDVAVIGMDCLFPQAPDVEHFWRNLLDGREAVTFFTDEELRERGVPERELRHPQYVKAGHVLDGIDRFDAQFFGISPREAELMDPQHRLLLEVAWGTLERAACDPSRYDGLVGVYAGASASTYLMFNLASHARLAEPAVGHQMLIGNGGDFLATRVSYKLGLEGPSVSVQSACSTSLVAVVLATQALLSYQCDLALAGGAAVDVLKNRGYTYQPDGLFSPDGHCRAYDSQAQGTVGGNGVGMVALKRLYDALRDRDHIHAVIKGSAINNDGARRAGFTAPSADSQALVITTALASASVEPNSLGYVEGHGTGTILGDPIEVAALNAAFAPQAGQGSEPDTIALGSLKPNIGHLDAAAGIASFIKTVLAVEHGRIPPTVHFREPNPRIRFGRGPFFVNTETIGWPKSAGPRRAGVSSFGLGGTNAHVVLEQAPPGSSRKRFAQAELFVLSAKSDMALEAATIRLAAHLRDHPELAAADVAYTLRHGRQAFAHRRILVADSVEDACDALEARTDGRLLSGRPEDLGDRPVTFMFTGFGDQYAGMARQLYDSEPVFRSALDRCAELLAPHLGTDLRPVIFGDEPEPAAGPAPGKRVDFRRMVLQPERSDHPLHRPLFGHSAVFAVEYALAALWRSWGIIPEAVIGHSLGEIVAACVAGVFLLEDALWLVASRARMMEQQDEGAMLAVALSERGASKYLNDDVALAAVNGPETCVLSGRATAVNDMAARLAADGVIFRRLVGRSGFHSPLMDPVVSSYRQLLSQVSLQPPQIKIISNMSGTWLRPEEATSPSYWARHMREPVRFADGIGELGRIPRMVLIEVGPGRTLCTAALQQWAGEPTVERIVLPSLPDAYQAGQDRKALLRTVGQLWLAGGSVDWEGMASGADAARVPLPGYPFQRQSYWVEPTGNAPQELTGARYPQTRWFWAPSWQRLAPLAIVTAPLVGRWLVFTDQSGLGARLAERLRTRGAEVITVAAGRAWHKLGPDEFQIAPGDPRDYQRLAADLRAAGPAPDRVVHCWGVDPADQPTSREGTQALLARGFTGLTQFLQAVEQDLVSAEQHWHVVTHGVYAVTGDEELCPVKATVVGLAKVLPQEYPNLRVGLLDVTDAGDTVSDVLADRVLAELISADAPSGSVALRGGHRWGPSFTPLQAPQSSLPRLRDHGVYLITGGLGRIGLVLARYLAEAVQARLVLAGPTGLPPRDNWDDPVHPTSTAARIAAIRDLEKAGAEVMVLAADMADEQQAADVVESTISGFGRLDGVIHCAGRTGAQAHKIMAELGPAETGWHFEPKIHAVHALSRALIGRSPGFVLLCSSLSSLLGGLGFGAYAAANAFLDAYAQQNPGWMSINWEAWRFPGETAQPEQAVGSAIQELALAPDEGRAVFEQLLALPQQPQIVVSTADIAERSRLWSDPLRHGPPADGQRHPRPNLSNPYVEPGPGTEQQIADVWAELLGVEQVGVHDNFFEMGGSSLLGLRVVHRLRNQLQMVVPLTIVYEGPTVRTLARLVDDMREEER
jgi:acyl transferase domain-containing protein